VYPLMNTYFEIRRELEERFWRERPQVLMLEDGEVVSVLADEREWIERHLRGYYSLRNS
jgi:hypothetical protein